MKILVTGAAGFVGANLCHRLTESGIEYLAVDDLSFGNMANLPKCDFMRADFNLLPDYTLDQYDILVHLATSNIIYAMNNPIETVINNAVNSVELFSRFKGKIVYTSTASVYGNAVNFPTTETDEKKLSNAYDTSKYIAEQFLRERGNFTTLRLSNVYGRFQDASNPYCGVLGKFVDKYISGKPFTVYGDGSATRDYTYIDDAIDAIVSAITKPAIDTEVNIATGIETSSLFIAQAIDINHPVNLLPERPIDKIKRRCLSVSKAAELLNWSPQTDIQAGIKKTIEAKRGF